MIKINKKCIKCAIPITSVPYLIELEDEDDNLICQSCNDKLHQSIYLIGSLRNPKVPKIANTIEQATDFEVFDSWFSPGPEADSYWRKYEKARGRTYAQALKGYAGTHIYEFDKYHIDRCDIGVLAMPAGKSGCLELGFMLGSGKPGFILFEKEPTRWDVMFQFSTAICFSMDELILELNKLKGK